MIEEDMIYLNPFLEEGRNICLKQALKFINDIKITDNEIEV